MDVLDQEASEDEAGRQDTGVVRPPSHAANHDLAEKERRYRHVLEQASASDVHVREKWDQWESNIAELTWTEVGPFSIPRFRLYLILSG